MNSLKNIIYSCGIVLLSITIWTACKKEANIQPAVSYVRVTNPQSSDSLLVAARQGQLIAIVGSHLGDAVEVWFNDHQSRLTPTYITNNVILVSIPNDVPKEISNTIKIVFKNGSTLLHNFKVEISKPLLNSMVSEYVNDGEIATIRGDYFYTPLTVTLEKGGKAELVKITDKELSFRIPAGADAGQITVKTNFGETVSNFVFRDPRNLFITSDPYEGWWNSSYVVSAPGTDDPPKINGNYIRFKKEVTAWSWSELAGGPESSMPVHSKRVPAAAIQKPEDYYFKFEVNTIKPYNGNMVKFNMALSAFDNNGYKWQPPFDTKGQWQTVVIPLTEVFAEFNPKPVVNGNGYYSRILIGNAAGAWSADICFDNLRIVPKVVK